MELRTMPYEDGRDMRIGERLLPHVQERFGSDWAVEQVWEFVRAEAKRRRARPVPVMMHIMVVLVSSDPRAMVRNGGQMLDLKQATAEAARLLAGIRG